MEQGVRDKPATKLEMHNMESPLVTNDINEVTDLGGLVPIWSGLLLENRSIEEWVSMCRDNVL